MAPHLLFVAVHLALRTLELAGDHVEVGYISVEDVVEISFLTRRLTPLVLP